MYHLIQAKRESGEIPERSGHCEQGVCFAMSLAVLLRRQKVYVDLQVRKPAGFTNEKLPWKVLHLNVSICLKSVPAFT